jgi:major membrane immunogen (membrane-anchored lipoprotein)
MKTKKIFLSIGMMVLLGALLITGCKKDTSGSSNPAGTQKLSVYLTDDPSIYDSVFIDIKYVEAKIDTSTMHKHDDHFGDNDNDRDDDHKGHDEFGQWDTLSIVPGIYNVSKLKNGIDTLLGTANINGTIRKIRITLGTSNSLNIAGVSYPLNLFPGVNSYLYVKINDRHHNTVATDQTALWVDFDISRSIVSIGGLYYLRPVLRPFCDNNFARISGKVLPLAATPLVTVYNATDTANAIPHLDGNFKIRGLKDGTYNVLYKGYNGYKDTTITGIQLQIGVEKVLPTVTLTK